MKRRISQYYILLLAVICLTVSGCRTAGKAVSEGSTIKENTVAAPERKEITVSQFVSDIRADLSLDGKKYSLDGKISMKRGEVMRINLTFMGFIEVGILEFSPKDILIVNRMAKEFTRMPYDAFDTLKRNNITFENMEYIAWEKLYAENTVDPEALDRAIENLINSNIHGKKDVKVKISVGKPDTSRQFETYTKVRSSYKEVSPELLMARLMSFR